MVMAREYKTPLSKRKLDKARQDRKRWRAENGRAHLRFECDAQAARDLADCLGASTDEAASIVLETVAMTDDVRRTAQERRGQRWVSDMLQHALANPVSTTTRVNADGSVTQVWADGDTFNFPAGTKLVPGSVVVQWGDGEATVYPPRTREEQIADTRSKINNSRLQGLNGEAYIRAIRELRHEDNGSDEIWREAVRELNEFADTFEEELINEFVAAHPDVPVTSLSRQWMIKWSRAKGEMRFFETMASEQREAVHRFWGDKR
jgi:hypothetical protein